MPTDIDYFKIFRSDNESGPFSQIGTSSTISFIDPDAIPGNTYCYYVISVDVYGNESDPSPVACIFFSNSNQVISGAVFSALNVVVVYRQDDSESQEFAERYKVLHGLSGDQLVSVPCSAIEILPNYATFRTEVESPLLTAILSAPLSNYAIYAIILMPRVPGGFYHEGDTISATSRLSRIHSAFTKKTLNPLYDRQVFKRFDSSDANIALICTRFDSPTSAITSSWFENTERAAGQLFATGTFFFDPYSSSHGRGSSEYQEQLLFFGEHLLQRLEIPVQTTLQVDPYIDPIIPFVQDDSFFWGWGADRGSLSYFRNSSSLRGFFYNADFDGAYTMRNVDERTWPLLAIRQGYIATAGAMSDPGIDGMLRPTPFFNSLFRGATLGEAMIFSVPHLDWTMSFFGDPLLMVRFPTDISDQLLLNFDSQWVKMQDCAAQSVIRIYRKSQLAQQLWTYILDGNDFNVAADLVEPAINLKDRFNSTSWKNDFVNMTKALFNLVTIRNRSSFPAFYPNLSDYLNNTNGTVSKIMLDVLQNDDVANNIINERISANGSWEFLFTLEHSDLTTFAFYHFLLEISASDNFDNILISKDSSINLTGWYFENSENVFEGLAENGLTSNYAGREVKYVSQDGENLQRGSSYFFRIRQKDQQTVFSPRDFEEIIYR